jgi:hypothetical protein
MNRAPQEVKGITSQVADADPSHIKDGNGLLRLFSRKRREGGRGGEVRREGRMG